MNVSYFDTPSFLSSGLHFITCMEAPIHIFGVYMILFKTPESMKSVKLSMFNLHFWSMTMDFGVSLLTSPFVLFPAIAGYPLGILKELGVPTSVQIYLIVSFFAIVGVAVLAVFENRFFVMFADQSFWRFLRIPFFVINYSFAVLFFIPPYLDIPDQTSAKETIFKKLPENLPVWIYEGPVFVLTTSIAYSFISISFITIFIIFEIVVFVLLLKYHMIYLAKKMTLSKSTLRMQRRFLNAIHIQIYTPLVILIVPLIYIGYSVYFNSYSQAANNFCFITFAFHGLSSTIIMLLIHKPYREVVLEIFTFSMVNKTSPVYVSRRNSFVSNIPV